MLTESDIDILKRRMDEGVDQNIDFGQWCGIAWNCHICFELTCRPYHLRDRVRWYKLPEMACPCHTEKGQIYVLVEEAILRHDPEWRGLKGSEGK